MSEAVELRQALIRRLEAAGRLTDPRWRAAFAAVPRELFVPAFFRVSEDGSGYRLVECGDPDGLAQVYRDDALVTQLDGDDALTERARAGEMVTGAPTSSSSAPGLMALMLAALEVADSHRVLEVGTGTGYNAALLCHRLGSDGVTSVDVDAGLVALARERLATLGFAPQLVVGDGRAGVAERAPYDRVMTTVAVRSVPTALVAQTRQGGRVLVCLERGGGGLLPLLTVDPPGRARGPFLPHYGGFMPLRQEPLPKMTAFYQAVRAEAAHAPGRASAFPAAAVLDPSQPFEFFAALRVPGLRKLATRRGVTWLLHPDGSWASHDGERVAQGGPRRLWDEVEVAAAEWEELGRAPRERFGLTVEPDGGHRLWLDDPDDGPSWPF